MHLFFDTVWKLHIGEIPEKPDPKNYLYPGPLVSDLKQYERAISAIKQNALTVGNPEAMLLVKNEGYCDFESDGNFYEWPGGYETKEIPGIPTYSPSKGTDHNSQTVAILTLPEEKKNTIEKQFECKTCGATYRTPTASGSVAAPKEEENRSLDEYKVSLGKMTNLWIEERDKNASLRQQLEQKTIALDSYYKLAAEVAPLKEALKELLPIVEKTFDSMARHEIIYAPVKMDKVEVAEIIDRACKLLSK